MPTISIPLGAKIIVERPDGTIETYVFKGGNPLEWESPDGARHTHVLDEPYKRIQVINP